MLSNEFNSSVKKANFDKTIDIPVASTVESGWLTFNNAAVEEFDLKNNNFYSINYSDQNLYFTFTSVNSNDVRTLVVREDTRAYFNLTNFVKNNNVGFKKAYFKIKTLTSNECYINFTEEVDENTVLIPDVEPEIPETEDTGDFKLFTKEFKSRKMSRENLCVSVRKEGRFTFNYNIVKQYDLEKNCFIRLFYDEKGNRIGFKFSDTNSEIGSRKMVVSKNNIQYGIMVNAVPFFKKYNNFKLTETKIYFLEVDEKTGICFIKL